MKQRPFSPQSHAETDAAAPPPGSRFSSLRRAMQGRSIGFSVSTRTVCALLAALCLLFFFVETQKTTLSVQDGVNGDGGGFAQAGGLSSVVDEPEFEVLPPGVRGGLKRFASFEEYVRSSRSEGGSSVMPVVNLGGKDVTIPSVIIVGGKRTGTSALFSMLGQHPAVASIEPEPSQQDSRGFMAQNPEIFPREADWPGDNLEKELPANVLAELFEKLARPYTVSESRVEGSEAPNLVTTAHSPGYLASQLAPYRLKLAMPNVKIVIVLRDPTERYYSELREVLCVKDESKIDWDDVAASFAMPNASKNYLSGAVLDYSPYDKKCLGEGATAADLWNCQCAFHKAHRPLLEGLYASHLARWHRVFDKSQIHVVEAKRLFKEPEKIAAEVAKFAGLVDRHEFFEFATDREASCDPRRRSSAVSTAYSKRKEAEPQLRKWFADHNDMASDLVGKDLGWNNRIQSAFNKPPS